MVQRLAILPTALVADTVTDAKLQHIHECKTTEDIDLIATNIYAIVAPVIVVHMKDHLYVVELPNRTETDLQPV